MNARHGSRQALQRTLLATGLVLVALAGPTEPAVLAATDVEVRDAMTMRAHYGLPAARSDVEALMGSQRDVGSERFGVPMTAAEVREIDPEGRASFSYEVRRDVLPWLEKRPAYAGAWIDQQDDGQLVVALTKLDPAIKDGIEARMPKGKRGVRIVKAAHSWVDLETAVERAWTLRDRVPGGSGLVFSAVDVERNRVTLQVDPSAVSTLKSAASTDAAEAGWQAVLGVPVRLEAGQAPKDTAQVCTMGNDSQNNCWKPIPAGVRTRSFSVSGRICTMGFQVYKASANPPNQFLTAGHCVHPYDSNGNPTGNTKVWHNQYFHKNASFPNGQPMGNRTATLYENTHNLDIARVALDFAAETTDKLYDWPNAKMTWHTSILANDVVRWIGVGSGSTKSSAIKSVSTCWDSEAWGYNHANDLTVCGGWAEAATSINGDSGAPVFTKEQISGVNYLTP